METISYILVKWGGYAGEDGPKVVKVFAFKQPTPKQIQKFAGARDLEHAFDIAKGGYLDVLRNDIRLGGNWNNLSLKGVAKLLGLKFRNGGIVEESKNG